MSPAYIKAVSEHLPKAQIVFDHFHLIKLFNEKLSDLRRELFREPRRPETQDVLKAPLAVAQESRTPGPQQDEPNVGQSPETECLLATAYYLKEELRQLWQQPNWRAGRKFLTSWCARATASGSASCNSSPALSGNTPGASSTISSSDLHGP